MSRLKQRYQSEVRKALQEKFKYENSMLIPSLRKIVVHMGIAKIMKEKNATQDAINELTLITGQKPVVMKAKKSVAGFKVREGMNVGLKVTLRGKRMYDFLERFVNIVCPRIPDFRGFKSKADGQGNYSLGLEDQQIFPEINLDAVNRQQGMHINFVTSGQSDEECIELLRLLGMPFAEFPVVVSTAA